MCGIAGILRLSPPDQSPPPLRAIPEAWLETLDASIRHRGPDGHGRFRDRATHRDGRVVDVALVHRRLSILDHAGGTQPMAIRGADDDAGMNIDEDRRSTRTAIVFNGCLYNHRELRKELESLGHVFSSHHSDTEVLLHAWSAWREGLWQRADGMYALALWDSQHAELILARDSFGEKPLYTLGSPMGSILVFSSSVPGLLDLAARPDFPPELKVHVEPTGVRGWLKHGWNPSLPFDTIAELPPATPTYVPPRSLPLAPPAERTFPRVQGVSRESLDANTLDAALDRAVRSRLDADVPLGCFLSGGIDSALICSYAQRHRPDLRAFTVRMPHPDYDESHAAAQTARALGIDHEILDADAHPADDLVFIIHQLGLPFGDSSLLPALWVSRAARTHVRVALSGDGGDELFLGYERHRALNTLARLRELPHPVLHHLARAVTPGPRPKSLRTRLARLLNAAAYGGYEELTAIFDPPTDRELGLPSKPPRANALDAPPAPDVGDDPHADLCRRHDLFAYLPFDLLRKSDTASMSCALEVRAPFLANEIRDLALDASRESLMPRGRRKGLLREVARRYLPDSIVQRPKMGFAIPVGEWFRTDFGGMKSLLLDTLHSADPFPANLLGFELNRAFIRHLLDEHLNERRDHAQRLYMLLVLAIWCRGMSGRAAPPNSGNA